MKNKENKSMNDTITTKAEKRLNEHGFFLLKSDTINIDDKISYPFIQYGRFVDDEHTACDMSIIFDPSQYSVMLSEEGSTVYVDPDLLAAILERTKELKYDFVPTHGKNTSLTDLKNKCVELGELVLNEIDSLPEDEKDKIYEETKCSQLSEADGKVCVLGQLYTSLNETLELLNKILDNE